MIYNIGEIRREVRRALDENKNSKTLLESDDQETLDLDDLINSKIEEGARIIEEAAPLHMLEQGHIFGGDAPYWDDAGDGRFASGMVLLPDDFMRLLSFKMSDWERAVTDAITADDPLYGLQKSRHGGVRGNWQLPVVAIVNRQEGLALEFYSCRNREAYISQALYLPYPRIEDGGIDLSRKCLPRIILMTAALTAEAYGEYQVAQALEARAREAN